MLRVDNRIEFVKLGWSEYDHILPVAHGGATTLENLQLLCAYCDRLKSDSL